ncbi:MAG: SIMPL domain-containing protein [bacterium]|nr:SIMPL domain-containing protein [bacterium]
MQENISLKIIPPKELKWVLLVLLSIFLFVLTISEGLEIKDKLKSKETITFSGEGKSIGVPDIASITLSVLTEKMTAKETMTENAKITNEVIKFVKEAGIDEKDVKTQSFTLSPRYDWVEGKRIFRGYQLTSTLAVKIRDLEKISDIIDGAVLRGANQIGDIQFVIDDPEKLKEEARNEAIESAKEKAQSIAKATGLKLGKIVSFSEAVTPQDYLSPYYLEGMKEGVGGGPSPEIEKGSQEIEVNVSLTFELK